MMTLISPERLLDLTENLYGIKADLSDATTFLASEMDTSISNFIDWIDCRLAPERLNKNQPK